MRQLLAQQGIKDYFIIYGDPTIDAMFQIRGDVMAVKAGDHYEALTYKVFSAFSAMATSACSTASWLPADP